MAPGVCETMSGPHQTLGSGEGDVCSHAVPFPFKLLLQFKAGVAKALTPQPHPMSIGPAKLQVTGVVGGENSQGIVPRISFLLGT